MIGSGTPDDGFHEAVAIVLDVEASAARLCQAFGFEAIWRGEASPGALELMEIDLQTGWQEALIGDPAQGRGFIRLFGCPDRPSGVMRDGAQVWDTGGVFDVNVRALTSIETLHGAMTRAGFAAFAPITAYNFSGLEVKEVVEHDADGLAIALIEQLVPPLEGFDAVRGPASFAFNASIVVPSLAEARTFVDVLGWKPVFETSWSHANGLNCIGLPLDVARTRRLNVGVYQALGRNIGSVEFIALDGEARDFSTAAPPDRGWAALRFPVADVVDFIDRAAFGGCRTLNPRRIAIAPYGHVEAAVAITPWGARLEAYRPINPGADNEDLESSNGR
jgi:catechol 2,3-dioxygenase-like lactoylglutathione lyase family enzyme